MKYVNHAEQLSAAGFNCAQSVAGAFAELLEGRISKEDLLRLSAPFGGGFARTRNLCGAVSGMGIIYGLLSGGYLPAEKEALYKRSADALAERFRARYGSLTCAELLQNHPERPCTEYIRGAAEILESCLLEEAEK